MDEDLNWKLRRDEPTFPTMLPVFIEIMLNPIQNVFDHCAQTLRRRKLKLGDYFSRGVGIHPAPGFSLAIATNINRSTPDFLTVKVYCRDII